MRKIFLILPLFIFLLASPVSAQNIPTKAQGMVKAKLTEVRLKACQVKEEAVKKQLTQLTKMATNMLDVFDKIATKVKDYYTNTVLPSGKSVPSYNTLVSDIQAKRTVVDTALAKAKTEADTFTCSGDNPKGILSEFHTNMRTVKDALKSYRTSINKLIVAIRTVIPTATTTPRPAED